MAWSPTGRWTRDETRRDALLRMPQQNQVMPETQPVTDQASSLTGLLSTTSTAPTTSTTTSTNGRDQRIAEREARRAARQQGGGGTAPSPTPTPTPTTPAPTTPNGPAMPEIGDAPTPADASVANQLTGLLDSNSPYIKQAREAGMRVANRRGLLNSSIAAGTSEAAAIAAAAPIASQDASQIHARNQTELEGWTNLRNAGVIQQMQDEGALQRLGLELSNRLELQGMGDAAALARLIEQGEIEAAIAQMQADNHLTQTQINANVSLMSNYMQAFATLAQNPEIPASARDAYMSEFLRVTQSGQALVNALAGTTVTWPTATPTPTTTPTTGGATGGGGGILDRLRVSA